MVYLGWDRSHPASPLTVCIPGAVEETSPTNMPPAITIVWLYVTFLLIFFPEMFSSKSILGGLSNHHKCPHYVSCCISVVCFHASKVAARLSSLSHLAGWLEMPEIITVSNISDYNFFIIFCSIEWHLNSWHYVWNIILFQSCHTRPSSKSIKNEKSNVWKENTLNISNNIGVNESRLNVGNTFYPIITQSFAYSF